MQINTLTLPFARLLRMLGCRVRLRGWNRLLMALFPVKAQAGVNLSFRFLDHTYTGKSSNYIDWIAFFYGAYEKELLELLCKYASTRKDCVFLDVGANVGHHALYMANCCYQVHAFEPLPDLCRSIREKLDANGIENVFIHQRGLGDADGSFDYYLPLKQNLGQGSFVASQAGDVNVIKLDVVHAGRYLEKIGVDRLDIVKIDVEGFEPDVLLGMRTQLMANRPLIVVEIGTLNRKTFPLMSDIRRYLPPAYRLMYLKQTGRLLIDFKLVETTDSVFSHFGGNLICVPQTETRQRLPG